MVVNDSLTFFDTAYIANKIVPVEDSWILDIWHFDHTCWSKDKHV